MSTTKACTRCRETKPVSEFGRDKASPDGLSWRCSACLRELDRANYRAQRKREPRTLTLDCGHCGTAFTYTTRTGPVRKYCSERCKANAGEAMRQARKQQISAKRCDCGSTDVAKHGKPVCPDCRVDKRNRRTDAHRLKRRLSLYGLTQADYDDLVAVQRGQCAICTTTEPGSRGWFIDHDHGCCPGIGSCGNCVRGLLCHDCNLLLGMAKDSTERLDRAKTYLVDRSQYRLRLKVVR